MKDSEAPPDPPSVALAIAPAAPQEGYGSREIFLARSTGLRAFRGSAYSRKRDRRVPRNPSESNQLNRN